MSFGGDTILASRFRFRGIPVPVPGRAGIPGRHDIYATPLGYLYMMVIRTRPILQLIMCLLLSFNGIGPGHVTTASCRFISKPSSAKAMS